MTKLIPTEIVGVPGTMLDGTTAFVTGASQGIGREIAITLAAKGANVALAARSDGIHETAEIIDDEDATLAIETDVTDERSVEAAIDRTVDEFGGLDCLVNNAGIAGPTKPIEEVTREEWEHTQDVNVTGMFLTTKHAVEHLRASDQGRVVNLSSISGKRPLVERTPYTASKMAVIGITRTLAHELGDDAVTVNAICPGPVRGPRLDSVIQNQADSAGISFERAKNERFVDDMALNELVEAEDIADLVAYLSSESGKHITGQDINVSGGVVWY
jgi:NAD(P)-dependent dehydrogenase (short-subunit alcohol dehydrogenase family)